MKLVLKNHVLYEEDINGELTPVKVMDKSSNLIINLRETLETYRNRIKDEKNEPILPINTLSQKKHSKKI